MTPIAGTPIVTAAQMRVAEEAAMADGTTVDDLMQRAGHAVAVVVQRLAAGAEVLVLCGPGNNGGDGYVAAAALARGGQRVRVAALGDPHGPAARSARARWIGAVESLAAADEAPILVDALFGTGVSRALSDEADAALRRLMAAARLVIAVDLPSGVPSDGGALLDDLPPVDLTLALGALKPAHLLQPAAARSRAVRVLDIGVSAVHAVRVLAPPVIPAPLTTAHKYSRGMVAVIAGAMPGAAALTASAAARAGAGYVMLLGSATDRLPHAIVRRRFDAAALADPRIGAIVVGPGLGRGARAAERLDAALANDAQLVIDGDALALLDEARLARLRDRAAPAILTPHAGEFDALFGKGEGSKIDRALRAARYCGQTVVFKGADTVIASGECAIVAPPGASPWLSTAGTGDVLAGAIAARLAATHQPLAAASAGVWLHGAAAGRLGAAFLADDLAGALGAAVTACR